MANEHGEPGPHGRPIEVRSANLVVAPLIAPTRLSALVENDGWG